MIDNYEIPGKLISHGLDRPNILEPFVTFTKSEDKNEDKNSLSYDIQILAYIPVKKKNEKSFKIYITSEKQSVNTLLGNILARTITIETYCPIDSNSSYDLYLFTTSYLNSKKDSSDECIFVLYNNITQDPETSRGTVTTSANPT